MREEIGHRTGCDHEVEGGSTGGNCSSRPSARRSREEQLADVRAAMEQWQQRWVDQRTAAAMLGVTLAKLRRWMLAGRGPRPSRDGDGPDGRVRFDVHEIRAYLADPSAYESKKSAS